ncbi:MAG: hypothetical protein NTY61_01990 [Candidatus Parcubacteria bacterium]|nr:hypothetical protein [Candidatus Parcubacteria bacterium]
MKNKILIGVAVISLFISVGFPSLILAQSKYRIIHINYANKGQVEENLAHGLSVGLLYIDLQAKTIRPIYTTAILNAYGWTRSVHQISYAFFLVTYKDYQIQKDNPIMFKNGNLVKVAPEANIYLVENKTLRLIPGPNTFKALGYKWSQVFNISSKNEIMNYYTIGEPVGPPGYYVYDNTQYGFEVKLQKTYWKGYSIGINDNKFTFNMPTTKYWAEPLVRVFMITALTPDQWEANKTECNNEGRGEDCLGTYLAQSTNYVFVYDVRQDCPDDLALTTCSQGLTNAIKTFKLIN